MLTKHIYQDARRKSLPVEETNRIFHQSIKYLQDTDIAKLQSDYFSKQAIKNSVDLPQKSARDAWISSNRSGTAHLTLLGVAQLRSALRAAKKDRSEYLRPWLTGIAPVITGIGGVIGMVIALLTLLWQHNGGTPD